MLRSCFRTRASMQLEVLALRHQIVVLQRRTSKRPRLRTVDRLFWVLLSRVWGQWRSALVIVKPETVIAWQRTGFRLYWRWKSRAGKCGRPCVSREIRELIRQMSSANPLWGAPRIHGELFETENSDLSSNGSQVYGTTPISLPRNYCFRLDDDQR